MKSSHILFFLAMLPLAAHGQQYRQPIPSEVTSFQLGGRDTLHVWFGDQSAIISRDNAPAAVLKQGRLCFNGRSDEMVLAEGSTAYFAVDGHAVLAFHGPYRQLHRLEVKASDHAQVDFLGSRSDTLYADRFTVSQLGGSVIDCAITLVGVTTSQWEYQGLVSPGGGSDGENSAESGSDKQHRPRYSRDPDLTFEWGVHNWGDSPFNGFAGVDDPAAVRMRPANLQLSLSYPFVSTRRFGAYVGLGLEWDRFRFEAPYVSLGDSAFADSAVDGCRSTLFSRSVTLPLTLRFDLGRYRDWTLMVSALPGLAWTGSRTGLRRRYDDGNMERDERDLTANRQFNPYQLDARVALLRNGVGLFAQFALLPLLKDGYDKLYPVRFGLIVNFGD